MKTKPNVVPICLLSALLLLPFTIRAQGVVTKVAAGQNDTLFLKSDGSLWGMGANLYGELGDGTGLEVDVPKQIVPSGVTAIAVGNYHSLFLKSDGSLWVMGYNDEGQLGDGSYGATNSKNVPEQIMASNVIAIAAGATHSLFLKSDGSLWGMGDNSFGQLGGGASGFVVSPTEIVTSQVKAIAAGGNHELFIKRPTLSSTQLWVLGDNGSGQLGTGNTNTPVFPNAPMMILSANPDSSPVVTAIATGIAHSLFIKSDGSLWAMGYNADGELGDNTTGVAPSHATLTPEKIEPSGVAAVSAGDYHSMFLMTNGSLWVMGDNSYGELGDGNTFNDGQGNITGVNAVQPEQIIGGGVTAIAAGSGDSLFVENDGSLWGMGNGGSGQLDNVGSPITPQEIVFPPPPPIGITVYSNQPVVIFPANGANYVLQMTTNLASPNWTPVTNGITFIGVQIPNAAPGAIFFRLQPP